MNWCLRITIVAFTAALFIFSALQFRRTPNPTTHGKPVSVWCEQLLGDDYSKRSEAREILVAFGAPAVPQLQSMINRRDSGAKAFFAGLLERVQYLGYRVPPASLSRERAAEVLADLGPRAAAASADLVQALDEIAARETVLRALREIDLEAELALRAGLKSGSANIRAGVASLLGDLGSMSAASEDAIITQLSDANDDVRLNLVIALGKSGSSSSEVPLFHVAQTDRSSAVREKAALALGKFDRLLPHTIASLRTQILRENCAAVRFELAKTLWSITRDAAAVIPVLLPLLDTPEGWKATYLLGAMGVEAEGALPHLVRVLEREQVPRPFRTPPSSAFAIGQIGPAALPLLQPLLNRPETRVRLFAVMSIGFMEKRGVAGEVLIAPALDDQSPEVRHAAAMSLASIGARGEHVVQALSKCLSAEDIFLRSSAADRLRELAPERAWFVLAE